MKYQTIWLEEIDSTNNFLLKEHKNYDNLTVIAAKYQSAGRGQRGNKWLTTAHENLTFSILLKNTEILANNQFIISKIATLSVFDYLVSKGLNPKIKWPNDIYVGNKKICGMLIENTVIDNKIGLSIVGIGININQVNFSAELINPTSLKKITKIDYDLFSELEEFMKIFVDYYTNSSRDINKMYVDNLYRLNQHTKYRDCLTNEEFVGVIVGITEDAKLIVQMPDNKIKTYAFKEISYII